MKQKVRYLRQIITVEIFLLLFDFLMVINGGGVFMAKYSYESELYTEKSKKLERFIELCISICVTCFLGAHSDEQKLRKPFLLFPVFGLVIKKCGFLLCIMFENLCWAHLQIVLNLLSAFFGGEELVILIALAYICDVSSRERRTFRIGMVYVALYGSTFMVELFELVINWAFFSILEWIAIDFSLTILLLVYGVFWILEPKTDGRYTKRLVFGVFNKKHCFSTFSILKENTILVLLMLWVMFVYSLVFGSDIYIIFLYEDDIEEINSPFIIYAGIKLIGRFYIWTQVYSVMWKIPKDFHSSIN